MKKLLNSIQGKITLWAGLCLLVLGIILTGYAVITLRGIALEAAEHESLTAAQADAAHVKAELEVALDAARTLAQALTAVKTENINLTRDDVNGILKQVLADNPQFLGVYTLWEPNAFDGNDAKFANTAGHDDTGRFASFRTGIGPAARL
jgi:methyl-accepting chemotaxis protein